MEAAQNVGAYADGTAHITGDLYIEDHERIGAVLCASDEPGW